MLRPSVKKHELSQDAQLLLDFYTKNPNRGLELKSFTEQEQLLIGIWLEKHRTLAKYSNSVLAAETRAFIKALCHSQHSLSHAYRYYEFKRAISDFYEREYADDEFDQYEMLQGAKDLLYDQYATLSPETSSILRRYFSNDLTMTAEEKENARHTEYVNDVGLDYCESQSILDEMRALRKEVLPIREANKAFAAHLIDQFSKQRGSTPEYPTYFGSHADLLLRYYAEEPLSEKEFEGAEYSSVEHHGVVAGMSYWSAEDSSICITNEFGKQIAAALTDIKTKAAHRLAAQNCIEPFVARNGLFCSPSSCAN